MKVIINKETYTLVAFASQEVEVSPKKREIRAVVFVHDRQRKAFMFLAEQIEEYL
jgi:hypothetical protein